MSIPVRSMVAHAVALSIASSLLAQQAASAADAVAELPEVTVTAQKREQNVQDVPVAISAFTGETLQSKGLGDIRALTNLTPNVNLDGGSPFSGDTSVLSASIRGVGQDDFAFNLDPGVGVYLDGVYLARTIGANQNLLDVDRIEILKGPQGTLFGRNSIGGAISIVTHEPGKESRFIATATGGSFDRHDLSATMDLPFSDTLRTSLSISSQVRDGYQKVIPYPTSTLLGSTPYVVDQQTAFPKAGFATSDTKGGQNLQVLRGKALWIASDNVNVTFSGDFSHQNQSSYPTTVLGLTTVPGGYGGLGAFYNMCIGTPASVLNNPASPSNPGNVYASLNTGPNPVNPPFPGPGAFNTSATGICGPRATHAVVIDGVLTQTAPGAAALGGAGYVSGPGGNNLLTGAPRIYWNFANTQTGDIDTTYANGPSFARHTQYGGSVTVDWSLPNNALLKSITGARKIDWRVGVDLDGTPESLQEVTDHQRQHQFSQEFQLTGKALNDRLDYVAGLYYFEESGFVHDYVPFGGSLYIFDVANDVDTTSYAAFTHLDYKLTDAWGLTIGARYSKDRKRFEGGQSDLDGFGYKASGCTDPNGLASSFGIPVPGITCQQLLGFTAPGEPYRYFPAGTQKQNYSVLTPTVGTQYHVNGDVMLYSSYSKGFKAGGWTTRLSNPIPDISDAAFGPEYNKTVELGVKSQLFNNHLQANVAVFHSKYSGIQLNIQEGPSPVLHNAGNALLKGAELELQAIVSNGFSVNFVGAYIDAHYTYVDPLATVADPNVNINTKLPKTPKYKMTIGPQYEFHLGNSARMQLGVDFTHTASMYNDAPNTALLFRPSVDNLGATVKYMSPSERYELTLGGTNLTDERYLTTGSVNGGEGETVGTFSRPREWYMTLRVKFGD